MEQVAQCPALKQDVNIPNRGVKKELDSNGIFVKSLTREGVVEEAPGAYKDVDRIAEVSHKMGIATKVARLVPIGVIKG